MKILVTGGAGYIGSELVKQLLNLGHKVRVLDSLLHGGEALLPFWGNENFHFINGDIRSTPTIETALEDIEAVIHLAAIVGDPACARNPELTKSVNLDGSNNLIIASKRNNVKKLIFASTCSNYGKMIDPNAHVDEKSELRPVSLYAETKVEVERQLLGDDHDQLSTTVLRFSTAFGVSARMRFDLTVNEFTMEAIRKGSLVIFGEQFWRPYAHITDLSRAAIKVLEAPTDAVSGQVFNVGANNQNMRKQDIVDAVCEVVPNVNVKYVKQVDDPRDYRVNFDKISHILGFSCKIPVLDGIREIATLVNSGIISDFSSSRYKN